jgi:hypothetical protein
MTTTKQPYQKLLDEIEPDWKKEPDEGSAGAAVAVVVLSEGRVPDELPEFSKKQIGTAAMRLRDNGYLIGWDDEVKLAWDGDDLQDGIAWALLMATAKGYVERVADDD